MTDSLQSSHTIAGTVLTMPVKIRKAAQHMAMFSVDADAAQQMIDYSGLQVCRYLPGRAIVVLMLMHYIDGDLGEYYEYGTNVMVNPPGSSASGPRALGSAGAFIHHLPVDQEFTLEAGTKIWGFPKVMADFTIRDGHQFSFDLTIDGQFALGMDFRPGLPVPLSGRTQGQTSYSYRDGVTREIPFEMTPIGPALPDRGCARASRRTSLRQGTRVARLPETCTDLRIGWQRADVVRRRAGGVIWLR